ncbi:peroxiredoxin [Candidatus Woesearchaeota archaeon CG11_big_fil_rev_8_21_14_0_20_43_8]|nr:MAG: peroxiredoxin [Candidatus Woesearchaeota archaeon CG11_big_fil_rev_8_21_14_0_20_43_8]PIO05396.1 MAG: peroxiredoxin [Candidatus Woesearchaeota archaeon CG08_land_8_20_14_0_20_43_7]
MINKKAPDFDVNAYHNNDIKRVKLSDHKGKWVVLFFYPADFTFICPTELGELADKHEEFKNMGVEIMGVSTDTAYVHKAWHDTSETIKKIRFPMLADPTGKLCRDYGTYIEDEGLSLRGTFIIDPDGIVKAYEIHDNSIGRSAAELLRKLQAAQYVSKNAGNVCPASWKPGGKTLKPGLELVGKI